SLLPFRIRAVPAAAAAAVSPLEQELRGEHPPPVLDVVIHALDGRERELLSVVSGLRRGHLSPRPILHMFAPSRPPGGDPRAPMTTPSLTRSAGVLLHP